MCGFSGAVGAIEYSHVRALESLKHRGPDDTGTYDEGPEGAKLSHARFSIQDLTAAGHQPMLSKGGRFALAYNGELYNVKELGDLLRGAGVALRSHCDTELLVEGWALWGVDFVRRCRGMFAFAIWDKDDRTMWLVRDRLGIKPLCG